ncbi:MAG TPA: ATP-binding protein [Gammaproteobacteria bacterium]|nr:ATP-binding protein [Gammaproteobacteria bacterium]
MDKNYTRWQSDIVQQALLSRRVIILAGARQCGKTTLAKNLNLPGAIYRTLDDVTLLESALSDPHGFVKHDNELMIIDEIQKASILLQAIKKDVDENQNLGRFLLTGSANIQSLPGVNESLAGRVRKIRLRPLAQGEIHATLPNFLQWAFEQKFPTTYNNDTKDSYITLALGGGYPEPLRIKQMREAHQWYMDYINSIIERDLKDIINIKRQDGMKELLSVLAAWSSKSMDVSAIASGLSLTRQTITTYINALESLYLIEKLPAWAKTDYDRVNKQDKIFMTDTGLMAAILNWRFEKVRLDGDQNGKLLETFVFTQLVSHIEALGFQNEKYNIYHYRDREKHEIDFIIENKDSDILGVEVKAGSSVSRDSFKHLKWFRDNIAKKKRFVGVVLYTGEQIASFGEAMWAIPMNVLWAPNIQRLVRG